MAESSAGRKNRLWAAAVIALLCAGGAPVGPKAQPAKAFAKWWTTCDNGGACATYGAGGGAGVALTLILRRGPEPLAPLRATLIADMPRPPSAPVSWRVWIDGRQLATIRARPEQVVLADFAGADVAGLAVRLISGQELRADGLGGTLSLTGASDALRQMDEFQGRSGTVTALIAKGRQPASAVAPAPSLPRVTATPARISGKKDPPNGAKGDMKICRRILKSSTGDRDMRVFEMEGGALLWIIPCGRRGEVDYDLVLVSRANGDKVRPALLSDLAPPRLPSGVRSNVRFDPVVGLLSEVASERGLPDCGRASTWVWNDGKFVRAREREMPECVGLPLELWPDTFRTVVRRG